MHSQPPKSPLSGGLWKLREGYETYRDLEIPPTEELNDPAHHVFRLNLFFRNAKLF